MMYVKAENDHLNDVLKEAVCCIKEALTMSSESDTWLRASRRENLLNSLFALLCEAREQKMRLPSLETVDSVEATYQRGDLGFVPKPVELRSTVPTKRNMECQTTSSFEDYLMNFGEVVQTVVKTKSGLTDVISVRSVPRPEIREDQSKSVLFFDETEMPGEEEGSLDLAFLDEEEAEEEEVEEVAATQVTVTGTEQAPPTVTETEGQTAPEGEGQGELGEPSAEAEGGSGGALQGEGSATPANTEDSPKVEDA